MDPVLEWGIDFIVAVQTIRSPVLDAFFRIISFLGDAEFYVLLAPIILWSVDYRLGARLTVVLSFSLYLNELVKNLFQQPRPCEPKPELCLTEAPGYGLPSGHSQNAIVFWGMLAHWIGKAWAWILAILMMVLIGFSRIYLGVHFPTDVFAGWALGIVVLAIYLLVGKRIEAWVGGRSLAIQLLLAVSIPLLFFVFNPTDIGLQIASGSTGILVGLVLGLRFLNYDAGGLIWKRAARFLIGAAIAAALFLGLRQIFPSEGQAFYTVLRLLRYALVGVWISAGAPWTFQRLKLADREQAAPDST